METKMNSVSPITPHAPELTPQGFRIEGAYENKRNTESSELFRELILEAYGATQCIIAHHLTYVRVENDDGYDLQFVEEIPSADTLIFDVDAAQKLWGHHYEVVLKMLAIMPVPQRDQALASLWQHMKTYGSLDDFGL
jgi:hypothetical protein